MFETINRTPVQEKKHGKNLFQKLMDIVSWLFLGVFAFTLLFTAVSNLNISGEYRSLIVQSGSMEPTIMTGDVILIGKAPDYALNDVVTFNDDQGLITTHRISQIISQNPRKYVTKGDANRTQDDATISFEQIMGKVIYTLPKLGYFLVFVRSKIGMVIFVGVPAFLIVIDEIAKIIDLKKTKERINA